MPEVFFPIIKYESVFNGFRLPGPQFYAHSTGKRYDIYSKRKMYNKERNTKKIEKEQKDKIIVFLWK